MYQRAPCAFTQYCSLFVAVFLYFKKGANQQHQINSAQLRALDKYNVFLSLYYVSLHIDLYVYKYISKNNIKNEGYI